MFGQGLRGLTGRLCIISGFVEPLATSFIQNEAKNLTFQANSDIRCQQILLLDNIHNNNLFLSGVSGKGKSFLVISFFK